MEIRDKVLPGVGAQDMNSSGYQVSDVDDIDFFWESERVDVEDVYIPRIDTLFSPTAFDNLRMAGSTENPLLLDEGGGGGTRRTLFQQR